LVPATLVIGHANPRSNVHCFLPAKLINGQVNKNKTPRD
jgi:hypothetical protein